MNIQQSLGLFYFWFHHADPQLKLLVTTILFAPTILLAINVWHVERGKRIINGLLTLVPLAAHGDISSLTDLALAAQDILDAHKPLLGFIRLHRPAYLSAQRAQVASVVAIAGAAITTRASAEEQLRAVVLNTDQAIRTLRAQHEVDLDAYKTKLRADLEAESPRFIREMEKFITERETYLKKRAMDMIDELRKALIIASEEMRKNPAYADIASKFENLLSFMEQSNLGADLTVEDINEMIRKTIFSAMEKEHGVRLNGRRG